MKRSVRTRAEAGEFVEDVLWKLAALRARPAGHNDLELARRAAGDRGG